MLKFGTHIEIRQVRGLDQSKEDAFAHAHVPRAQRLKKSPCYILTATGPIVLKFGMYLETKQLIRFLCARSLIAQKASYWYICKKNIFNFSQIIAVFLSLRSPTIYPVEAQLRCLHVARASCMRV